MSGPYDASDPLPGAVRMDTPNRWLTRLRYPDLWEAVDEALLATAQQIPDDAGGAKLAEVWLKMPKRFRARLHGELRAALRRRMPPA